MVWGDRFVDDNDTADVPSSWEPGGVGVVEAARTSVWIHNAGMRFDTRACVGVVGEGT
jgi:hypothetical protein